MSDDVNLSVAGCSVKCLVGTGFRGSDPFENGSLMMGRTACALSVLRGAERSLNQGHGRGPSSSSCWPRWWMLASEKRLFPEVSRAHQAMGWCLALTSPRGTWAPRGRSAAMLESVLSAAAGLSLAVRRLAAAGALAICHEAPRRPVGATGQPGSRPVRAAPRLRRHAVVCRAVDPAGIASRRTGACWRPAGPYVAASPRDGVALTSLAGREAASCQRAGSAFSWSQIRISDHR